MYQALYRQYRPKNFDEVLGQKHITTTLKNQILKGNVGHAYLFAGTRGTGKTSTAKIFARAVNCLNPINGNPCNQCEVCTGILDESIMDVMEMDAASNNSVDDIRDLREKVIYPPAMAKYKVYIVDEVHMLSKGAFNALLKTLEEPPKHLIFILATTEMEKLPQTILSRCQRFDFKRIVTKDIMENMQNICNRLDISVEDRALNLIARNSDGAMRDALSLLDQCISFKAGDLTYEDTINILGIANTDLIFNMVDNIKDKELEKVLFAIDETIRNGKDIHQFIKDLIYHFRNLMVVKTSQNPADIIDMDQDTLNQYLHQSKSMTINFILKALDILSISEGQAKWSTQPRIILEMAAIKLIKLEEEMDLEERIKRLEMGIKTEKVDVKEEIVRKESSPLVKKDKPKEKSQEELKEELNQESINIVDDGKELLFETISKEWSKILKMIKDKRINTYALLMEGIPISYNNNLLTIGYKEGYGFHKEAVSGKNHKDFVEQIVSSYFNKNITVNFVIDEKKTEILVENKDNKEEAIKEVIDFFGKDIVEIK
jgi:DNA polymerase-3 subunit gamma/tau